MLAFRIIAAMVLLLCVIVLGAFFWSLFSPDAGRLDANAARRIRQLCGFDAECKVRAGDLFDGDWDKFYEFGSHVTQQQISQILGTKTVRTQDMDRVLVFMRDGKVIRKGYEKSGTEMPLNGEVDFEAEHHRDQNWVVYRHDTWLRVHSFPVDSSDQHRGTYYSLTSIEAP